MRKWLIERDGKEQGPYSTDELKQMATDGKIDRESRIRPEGTQTWKKLSEIKGLFKAASKVNVKQTAFSGEDPDDFDPYRKWLGIPADKRPPTHYQLLGISPSEEDRETIKAAADRQQNFVRQFRGSAYDEHAVTILFQLQDARATLLEPEARLKYDRTLNLAHKKQRDNARAGGSIAYVSRPVGESSGLAQQFAGVMAVIVAGFVVMWLISSYFSGKNADNNVEVAQPESQPAEQKPEQKAVPQLVAQVPALVAAVEPLQESSTGKAMKALQGEWLCIASEEIGKPTDTATVEEWNRRCTIKGNAFTMERTKGGKRESYVGSFELDAVKGHFNWAGTGPLGAPVEWIGIYELNGNNLKLCYRYQREGKTNRPTRFETDDNKPNISVLYTFKQVVPENK